MLGGGQTVDRSKGAVNVDHSQGMLVGDFGTVNSYYASSRPAITWPAQFGAIPPSAHLLQNRPQFAELDRVGHSVFTLVLSGHGGVGKTQIAAQHVRRRWDDTQVDLLLWINAASADAIRTAYATAASAILGVDVPMERAADQLLGWLASTQKRWIVVLDDLLLPGNLQGLWPPHSAAGRTLITTRYRGAALDGDGRRVIDVGVFSAEQSLSYLNARVGQSELLEGAAELAADLGHLPLALAQASAYAIDRNLSAHEYRAMLADQRARLADLLPSPQELPDDHERTVATTWALSISLADTLGPAGLASPVLSVSSMLDPNGFPRAIYATEAVANYLSSGVDIDQDVSKIDHSLQILHRLSLLTLPPRADGIIRIHGLVQRAVRDNDTAQDISDNADQVGDIAWATADGLLELWPDIERDRDAAQIFRINTAALVSHAGARLWHPIGHPILFRLGRSLGEAGLLEQAVQYFHELNKTSETYLGAAHEQTLSARANGAMWQASYGDPRGALATYEDLLPTQLQVVGSDHPDTLMIRNNMAFCRAELGDLPGAIAEFERLLTDRRRILGPDHPATLTTRHNLAARRADTGDLTKAAVELHQLVDDQTRILGPKALDTLATRLTLAETEGKTANAKDAARSLEEIVADFTQVLSPDHPDTLSARNSLAGWRAEATGDADKAVAEFKQLLSDQIRILGPDHPDTIRTQHNLAGWRSNRGDMEDAVIAHEQVLDDRSQRLGNDHPMTMITRSNLAHFRATSGDVPTAIAEFEMLLTDRIRILGNDHPDTLQTRHNVAGWRTQIGDTERALSELRDLLSDEQRVLGIRHPYTIVTMELIAHLENLPASATDDDD